MRFSLSKTLKTVRSQLASIHTALHKKISRLWCKHKWEMQGVKCNKPLKSGLLQGILASPGRFELPASRLGVWCTAYSLSMICDFLFHFIRCKVILSLKNLPKNTLNIVF